MRVELPAAPVAVSAPDEPRVTGEPAHASAPGRAVAGREPATAERVRARVLVVDDEHLVAVSMKRALHMHDVVVVGGGAEALSVLRADGEYDIVLCDLMMPEVSGVDVYETLEREAPELARRLVFVTGGVITPSARDLLARVRNERLDKPYDTLKLRELVAARAVANRSARA